MYNYFRDYDQQVGRYVESDPVGLKAGVNTYAYTSSDRLRGFDPLGLWGQDAHNVIILNAFPALPWGLLQALEEGSAEVDSPLNQGPSTAYQHAMRAPNQSVADAQQKMCAFVKSNFAAYQSLSGKDQYSAYVALGRALHPIMDSTSPAHAGWQVWDNPVLHPGETIPHGNAHGSIEGVDALTDALLLETLRRIADAMNGKGICTCGGQ